MNPVLAVRDFRLFLGGRFCAALARHMQAVATGWYLYDLTGDPLSLAYAGLAVFLPIALLSLPGGDLADRVDRRRILGAAHGLMRSAIAVGAVFAGVALFGCAVLVFGLSTSFALSLAALAVAGAAG